MPAVTGKRRNREHSVTAIERGEDGIERWSKVCARFRLPDIHGNNRNAAAATIVGPNAARKR